MLGLGVFMTPIDGEGRLELEQSCDWEKSSHSS